MLTMEVVNLSIYDTVFRSIGFSEINESAGISKSEFRKHKFFAIFGEYFRVFISSLIKDKKCVKNLKY